MQRVALYLQDAHPIREGMEHALGLMKERIEGLGASG